MLEASRYFQSWRQLSKFRKIYVGNSWGKLQWCKYTSTKMRWWWKVFQRRMISFSESPQGQIPIWYRIFHSTSFLWTKSSSCPNSPSVDEWWCMLAIRLQPQPMNNFNKLLLVKRKQIIRFRDLRCSWHIYSKSLDKRCWCLIHSRRKLLKTTNTTSATIGW